MGKMLSKAGPETVALMVAIIEAEYPAFLTLEPPIDIGLLFAASDKPGKPALSSRGHPAAGICRLVSEEDRAAGGPDVMIILDQDRWPDLDDTERYALLHHELHHIEPVKMRPRLDAPGHFCDVDSLGRPKIRLRKHDFEIGGFRLICERHGEAALERQHVESVHRSFGQQVFPFAASKESA